MNNQEKSRRIIHSIFKTGVKIGKALLQFFFPIYCLKCRREGKFLCAECADDLPSADTYSLPDWILASFDYKNETVSQLVWRLKYAKQTAVATEMVQIWHSRIIIWQKLAEIDRRQKILAIPTPLHWSKKMRRGFNQAEILAQNLIKLEPDRWEEQKNLLKKIKNTKAQVKTKDRTERLENLADAFVLKKNAGQMVRGRTILLIDDVVTTGATLTELRRLLLGAGAKKVLAITFAHG
ncbi:MAG: Phosphoribosyltransferase [Parcubacteria group bacterium GW2011_GWC1_43_11b]|uniref:Phosphoribosyltransferase domain-containing protein n=1 Tax=Candidatus Vogelbacteria bacterium RIFOXYB1_FULL_42_16 TaxID=1802436 RepID=A0A1G2QEF8_9BACT|nr:MAG: Phosphoribosyltransferase [Parcubacteria group bacterium GW2011_GWB1_42_9]KKS89014.1 MAG: Phosphoribosyltransferase [Parcubacteria group bacterium GW2011_GWC1_43_11b]KKT10006.1 MAG: Phosphoribosyltransferase [Parcubacteria group bacterium GW2011_GWA1_43_21]OHA58372.1 MAG: hypothetical protein A2370_01505 [Candidatus Vogelbacteria bacterium RIFOXYB1_FULL_42_16]